jgi:integrase/recombinase XerD
MSDPNSSHAAWLSKLKNHLVGERYATSTGSRYMTAARHFLADLEARHVDIDTAQPAHVELYLQQALRRYRRRHGRAPGYKTWRRLQTDGIHMLLRIAQNPWPPVAVTIEPAEERRRDICGAYARWMADLCGRSPGTMLARCGEARHFLDWLGERATRQTLATLSVLDVDAYMKDRARSLRRPSLRQAASNIRGFLRWLHSTEQTGHDLSRVVVSPPIYTFESIPRAVRAEDVKTVLAAAQKDRTPKGIRDYAILMLLSTYGLRAGEITGLRLEDVDWRRDIIHIRHKKTGAVSDLPLLPATAGEALLRYLQKSRPQTHFREVFIRCCAPYSPFKAGSNLNRMVRRRLESAGVISTGKHGLHAFRHGRAVSLLRAMVPVKEIGDLLGHRSAESTLVYLKLATEDLRAVAMEIPGAVRA